MTEFERENLDENGNAFDTSRLETKNARIKTKDRRFTTMQEEAVDMEEIDKQFASMPDVEGEELNKIHNTFDTGRWKTERNNQNKR
ncbi:hypothetical protein V1477_008254 [Vespula maculifrons]|uniref:Uncharacterized protein n=1 Tax=Vespula maculifrons TaxID=7453 RepID=A0ABD2CD73_VESMC